MTLSPAWQAESVPGRAFLPKLTHSPKTTIFCRLPAWRCYSLYDQRGGRVVEWPKKINFCDNTGERTRGWRVFWAASYRSPSTPSRSATGPRVPTTLFTSAYVVQRKILVSSWITPGPSEATSASRVGSAGMDTSAPARRRCGGIDERQTLKLDEQLSFMVNTLPSPR